MLHLRKTICLFLLALLLAQPVFAAEAPTETAPVEPDILTAVRKMDAIPTDFGIHAKYTEALQWLRSLTASPLYAMEDGNWVPVLAGALPVDVTAEYAGTYDIPADAARGYAFRILLNPDARWEDGSAITAGDCTDSIKALFTHENTQEDWLFLANAAAIANGSTKSGNDIISLKEAGFSTVTQAWVAGYKEFFVDIAGFWGLEGGWKSVSDRTRIRDHAMPAGLDEAFVSTAYLYRNYLMEGEHRRFLSTFVGIRKSPGNPYTMDDLGLISVSDGEFVIVLQSPATASTLMQHLEKLVLCRKNAAEPLSCGPYRIASATAEELILEPNPNWWGEPDPRGYDRILCQKIGT